LDFYELFILALTELPSIFSLQKKAASLITSAA